MKTQRVKKAEIMNPLPPAPWENLPMEEWESWKWQLANRLNTEADFSALINLSEEEKVGLVSQGLFRVDVTPYFASLMDPEDPNCPIRLQVIPNSKELVTSDASMIDSLAEDAHSPVHGLVHRYPDRVLMLLTTQCASYCRFCTRSRIVGSPDETFSSADYDNQIEYIARHIEVRDVLLSGGDPLVLPEAVLEKIIQRLYQIPHVEVVRLNTRVPVFMPQRVTDSLVKMLSSYPPMWINLNLNHPKEITPELEIALAKLANAGIPLGTQTVLMAGINDCPNIILELVRKLVKNRVRPYYLYQADLVQGAMHFRTPISKGIEIMEALRGHTSGYAIPVYAIDAPQGGGKVPILPNYLLSMSEKNVVLRNYEGLISSYAQPINYQSHDPETCAYCQTRQSEDSQRGISALLAGKETMIKPEGWDQLHERKQ